MSAKKFRKYRTSDMLSIPEFFHGKSVFITGATGFLGKVLVEKLLRSCPGIDKIYIVMRQKKGKDLDERLKEMTSIPIFAKLKNANKGALEKIIPMKGDISRPKLGLSEEDRRILIEEVAVVFHVAASVRFDDPLKKATLMNTRGTAEIVEISKAMKKLESFLHVSTTYCNTHLTVVEEQIYPAPANWKQIVKIAEEMEMDTLEVFSPKILGQYPNTYTFTKSLAEQVVYENQHCLPAVIFRPSIVIATLNEPMPGWVDNFNGPVGLMVASGKGIVRTVYTDPNIRADYMPVDVAVKAMITAAWHRGASPESYKETPVYNCSSYNITNVTQGEVEKIAKYVSSEVPLDNILWVPGGTMTAWKYVYYLQVFLFHLIPGFIVDTALKLANKKPILLKIHRKIFLANMALEAFLTQEWIFKNQKLIDLENDILEEDRAAFTYNFQHVDEIEYFRKSAYGGREYLLKEDNTGLPEAKKHFRRMYWVDKTSKSLFWVLVSYLAVKLYLIQTLSHYVRTTHALLTNMY